MGSRSLRLFSKEKKRVLDLIWKELIQVPEMFVFSFHSSKPEIENCETKREERGHLLLFFYFFHSLDRSTCVTSVIFEQWWKWDFLLFFPHRNSCKVILESLSTAVNSLLRTLEWLFLSIPLFMFRSVSRGKHRGLQRSHNPFQWELPQPRRTIC